MPEEVVEKTEPQATIKEHADKNPNLEAAKQLQSIHRVERNAISDPEDQPEDKPRKKTTDKEFNFRQLRESKEAAEKKLNEIEEQIESLKKFNDRYKEFDQQLGEKYDGSLEKFQQEIESKLSRQEELQKALDEKNAEIERVNIESSEWYQENVVRPVTRTKESYLALFGNSEQMQAAASELLSKIGDNTEPLSFSDRAAVTDFISKHDALSHINPTFVMGAIEEMKGTMRKANDIIQNKESAWKEQQHQEELALLQKAKDQIEVNLYTYSRQAQDTNKEIRGKLAEKAYGVFDQGEIEAIEKDADGYMRDLISGSGDLNWGHANALFVKSRLFDALMEDDRIKAIVQAKERETEGARGTGERPSRVHLSDGESAIERLRRERKSLDSPNREVVRPG